MPAKKGGKKKLMAGAKEIQPMPALVFNNIRLTNDLPPETAEENLLAASTAKTAEANTNLRQKFITEQRQRQTKMIYWLYIGMAIMLCTIAGFYGYALYNNLTSFNWKKTPENKIVEQAQNDFGQSLKDKPTELQTALTKLQIQEILKNAIQNSSSSLVATTSPSTTLATSSTQISTTTNLTTTTKN